MIFDMYETRVIIPQHVKSEATTVHQKVHRTSPLPVGFVVVVFTMAQFG